MQTAKSQSCRKLYIGHIPRAELHPQSILDLFCLFPYATYFLSKTPDKGADNMPKTVKQNKKYLARTFSLGQNPGIFSFYINLCHHSLEMGSMLFTCSIQIYTIRMHIKKQPGVNQVLELLILPLPGEVTKGSNWHN